MNKEKVSLNDKSMELDKVVKAITRKVLSLENEITEIKTKPNKSSEVVKGPYLLHSTPKKDGAERKKNLIMTSQ